MSSAYTALCCLLVLLTTGSCLAACPSGGSTDYCGADKDSKSLGKYGANCNCVPGLCCSEFGYCGPSVQFNANDPRERYCGANCQKSFGVCDSSSTPPPAVQVPVIVTGPPTSKTFTLTVDGFQIGRIRSANTDTLFVTCYGKINGQVVTQPSPTSLGDKGSGKFSPGTSCSITAKLGDQVELGFQITNTGNSDSAKQAANAAVTALSGILTASGQVWAKFIPLVTEQLFGFLFANCDGVVAADKHPSDGAKAAAIVQAVSVKGRRYDGYNSPAGCGANSIYYVDWSVSTKENFS